MIQTFVSDDDLLLFGIRPCESSALPFLSDQLICLLTDKLDN